VIVWLQVALLLQQSVACQVRVMDIGQKPFVTVLSTVMPTWLQQASRAVGSSKLHAEPHSTVLLLEQVITGGVVSRTVTIWLQMDLLPQQSVACQVRLNLSMQGEAPVFKATVLRTVIVTLVPQQSS